MHAPLKHDEQGAVVEADHYCHACQVPLGAWDESKFVTDDNGEKVLLCAECAEAD